MSTPWEYWLQIAGAVFGLWSFMLPLGIWMMKKVFDNIVSAIDKNAGITNAFQEEFKEYVLAMERRITIVEERQSQTAKILESKNHA
jgi:hypothetical protein